MKTNNLKLAGKLTGLIMFLIAAFLFTYSNLRAQDISTDNIDDEADLFNANIDYKGMFQDLSTDGEWIQMNKEDLVNDSKENDASSGGVSEAQSTGKFGFVWVWRPNTYYWGWSPYTNGRWEYTDDGWCWVSDYDWGWACYHYGRWVYDDFYGWIWIPGSYWAPAWVDWCYNDYYVGWYPRGLWYSGYDYGYYHRRHYNRWIFVHRSNFHDRVINKTIIVKKDKIKEIMTTSNNIAGVKNENGKIINIGPKVNDIEATINKKIEQKKIDFTNIKSQSRVDETSVRLYKPTEKNITNNGSKKNQNDVTSTIGNVNETQPGAVINQDNTKGKVGIGSNSNTQKTVNTNQNNNQVPTETTPNVNNNGTKSKNNNEIAPAPKPNVNNNNSNETNNNNNSGEKTKSKKVTNNNNETNQTQPPNINNNNNGQKNKTVTPQTPPSNKNNNDSYSRKDKNKGTTNTQSSRPNNNSGNKSPSHSNSGSTPKSSNSGNHNSSNSGSHNSGNHNSSNSGSHNSGSKTKSNK
jgi:hypothetical protein